MGALSTYLENAWLNTLRGSSYTAPSLYIALFTSPATEVDFGQEISDPNYARQKVNFSIVKQDDDGSSYIANTDFIEFAAASEAWGRIVSFAVVDSATKGEGHMLYYGLAATPPVVNKGEKLIIRPNELVLSLG